jgi:ATP-dependent Clp protease protease subunit
MENMMQKFLLLLMFLVSFSLCAETITLTDQNTLSLNSRVDSDSMGKLMSELQALNKLETSEPIYLFINSPGGSVYDGFDFIRYARTSRRKINTITLFAASMGFQIVQGMTGKRYMVSYSTLMSHRVKGGFDNVEIPGSQDTRYAHLLSHIKEQDELVVERTKGKFTLKTYAELIRDEYWANSTRAIKDGFADEEAVVVCDKSLDSSNSRVFNMQQYSVNVEFSNCPMITIPLSVKPINNLEYLQKNNIDINKELNKELNKLLRL